MLDLPCPKQNGTFGAELSSRPAVPDREESDERLDQVGNRVANSADNRVRRRLLYRPSSRSSAAAGRLGGRVPARRDPAGGKQCWLVGSALGCQRLTLEPAR